MYAVDRAVGVAGMVDWAIEAVIQAPFMLVTALLMVVIRVLAPLLIRLPINLLPMLQRLLQMSSLLMISFDEVDKVGWRAPDADADAGSRSSVLSL